MLILLEVKCSWREMLIIVGVTWRQLVQAIQENPEIRGAVCSAMVQLVRSCANKAAFIPVAKNFMIVFLNVYVIAKWFFGRGAAAFHCTLSFPFFSLSCQSMVCIQLPSVRFRTGPLPAVI
jgi:hypothetical protein